MRFFPRRQSDENYVGGDDYETGAAFKDGRRRLPKALRSRALLLGAVLLVLTVLALGAWVAIGAFHAKTKLEQARSSAQDAKSALLEGDTQAASGSAKLALVQAQAAHDATHSIAWNVVAAVPWLGSPFRTGQQVTDVVMGLASDVLRPAADVGIAIAPDRLYRDGRVDVALGSF